MSSWKHFIHSTRLSCSSRTLCFGWAWLSFGLCRTSFCSCVGDRQHVPPLLLQPLHGAAQLLNCSSLGGELLVQTLYPDAKCGLGLTLVPAWTWLGLFREEFISVCKSLVNHIIQRRTKSNISDVQSKESYISV